MRQMHEIRKEMFAHWRQFIQDQERRFPENEVLRADLHCHDRNSDVTDELWGRILRIPETWLGTDELVGCLQGNGMSALTITNHNNARSCWDLLERGVDVLPAAEFTCTFPENEIQIHVLTYGFTPQQEEKLVKLRKNIYRFLEYTSNCDLPTVQPHPLYFYNPNRFDPLLAFEKFCLLFERFEVLNGQREIRQSLLTRSWIEGLDQETLEQLGRKHGVPPERYCREPYRKRLTGGSDDHMGIFAGSCGTRFHIPDLALKLTQHKASELLLEALRSSPMAPFGVVQNEEKLNIAFLDYFCQIALNMKDPGLVRMFLHRGSLQDKLACLALSNGIQELKRHRLTMGFFKTFHEALKGKKAGRLASLLVSRDMKPVVAMVNQIARSRRENSETFIQGLNETIPALFRHMNQLVVKRLRRNWQLNVRDRTNLVSPDQLVRRFEMPSHLRLLFDGNETATDRDMSPVKLTELFDNLSFPLLASGVIAGSMFTSHRVLQGNRADLDAFSERLDVWRQPRRILWLTDTLEDRNGVSTVLQSTLKEVVRRDLPIDFLICANQTGARDHLRVVPMVDEILIPESGGQVIRIPDILKIMEVFRDGGYDRIICSTELVMGLVAMLLKQAFSVPAWFYMHTDWLEYFKKNSSLDSHSLDRVRRLLRAFYKQFDGVFVLNSEHRAWLASPAMGLAPQQIHQTAHWVEEWFRPHAEPKSRVFPGVDEHELVLLFTGRLSEEKGVMDLPQIVKQLQERDLPVRMVFAGTGPAEPLLREALPDAVFLGWVERRQLPPIYSAADFLVLPSRFDTFGCVVLEAMSCACPVAAYNTKGPKDIITHKMNGILAEDAPALAEQLALALEESGPYQALRNAALVRANGYCPTSIMDRMLKDIGMLAASGQHQLIPFKPKSSTGPESESLFAELLEIVS